MAVDLRKLLVAIFMFSLSFGQGPPDNIGRQFIVSFMENDQYGNVFPLELYVTTSEKRDVHVNITSPKWSQPPISKTITVKAGQVVRVKIDDAFRMKGSVKSSKAILVDSDGDISVYGGNKEDYSNDVFCGIPVDALGNEYYAMCYGPAFRKTEIGVAATEDGTIVKVTLPNAPNMTVTFGGKTYHGGEQITIPLDKYENFQLQSIGDLTGAHIESNHPISAYSGNIKTNIGSGKWQDHLVEQLTPVDTWGKRFVTAPIPKRTTGDYFRIVASEDNTVINIAGMPSFTLAKAGDWKQVTLPSNSYKSINATKPVFMAQFVLSQLNALEPADPSMMIIPPYELFNAGYTFATPEYSHPEYFHYENEVLLVIKSDKKDGLLLDGLPLPTGTKWHPIEGTNLVGTYVDIPKGSHTVKHKDSTTIFGSYLYGHAYHESYAFPTGMRLAKINAPCTPSKPVPGDGLDNDCDGKIDEELCTPDNNKNDDDGDGRIDEDCVKPSPVDGHWGSWSPWSSCSVTCEKGVQLRNRSCDHPAPMYNGTNCTGTDQESKPCDTGKNCPLDANAACKNNKGGLLANPIDCAQYYDCSQKKSSMGQDYLKECKYPDLFSPITKKCQDFQTVNCDKKPEPQAPCEYVQNQCNGTDPSCNCPKRLPSCIGKPDGNQEFPGKRAEPDYITCFKNRTMKITKCEPGKFFDPRSKICKQISGPVLNFYCRKHPTAKLPYPNSCAKFQDCSKGSASRLSECTYPDLFSTQTGKCENFTTVKCDKRPEPQAPCEYDQNLCPNGNSTCQKCPERLPSCIGLPDGDNPIPTHEWTSRYITCYKNRTLLPVHKCPKPKIYHPVKKICTEDIKPNEIPKFCKANPTAVTHSLSNCAEFYNCSDGNKAHECHYPDLFSKTTHKCENFTGVQCDNRTEPQAPCDYKQNVCKGTNCKPCLPSCVGIPDGDQSFPTKLWMEDYIRCYKNRTITAKKCPPGQYFHPIDLKCKIKVDKVDVPDYCKAHPKAILPDPDNCAHYFNCSDPTTATITRATMAAGNYRKECHYPDLYDDSIKQCNKFEMVNCDKKPEPQAPCEYQQNLCQAANKSCDPCPQRLPSCIGKSDGLNPVPSKMWQADYIKCYKNRTMEVTKCPTGKYFNPRLNKCMKIVEPVDIPDYCKVHPAAMIPDPTNCAKFYNCSQNMATKTAVTSECKYPDLFSRVSNKCEKFQNVSCDTRKEPQAPCEYDQNLCKPGDMKCESCPKRLPSCRSLPDGDEAVQSALWTDLYVTCLLNRTMAVRHCPNGQVFDPNQLHCVSKIPKGNIDPFCQANPTSIVPHPDTCGQYYNCSAMSKYGHHLQECHYPDLFDEVSLTCKNFEQVKCKKSKHEPEAPCEYLQNRCNSSDPNCLLCPKRLPSCIGHPDGDNPFPNKLWMSDYITCYKNRTLNVTHCNHGYFNPRTGKCQDDVPKVDVPDYCKAHPKVILPDPDNCAHYFNCSDPTTATITRATMAAGNYRKECHYPDLYDDSIKQCNKFEMVNCDKKPEPQAPCEYQQNLCQAANKSCDPCPQRLPSCVGKSDGLNPVPTKMWQADYIKCYKNRTMEVTKCPAGKYFNPRLNKCMKIVQPVDVPDYCKAHPKAILPDPDNCAHYFNCSDPTTATITRATMAAGNYRKECHYPDLYDDSIKQCNKFEMVNCDKKPEPQAPCEYQQNLCQAANKSCDPCPERLPSCIGKSDGLNPVPTKMWQADYIKCYKNRTMEVTKCPTGKYFNPRLNKCMKIVEPVDIPDYCKVHPAAMIPDPTNCAKFYNCSQNMATKTAVTSECKYPDLFSRVSNKCEKFQNVSCDTRKEPQAPCEYDQNLCKPGDMKCESCPKRLPSCRSLPDGDEAVQSALWTDLYVTCLLNRTMAVRHCPNGQVFDPNQLHCVSKIPKGNIDPFCQANPTSIVPHPDTCGQYYNCSAMSKYGHHLQECHYPDLFDEVSLRCKNFEQVKCNKSKHEPEAPCEYLQNRCNNSDPNCLPCPKRLPSCIGHPDGDNPFPNKLWMSDYITCYKNRTLNVTHCNHGYFNPRTGKCQDDVPKVDVPDYCKAHPKAILPDPDNCAHYFNCSDATTATITRATMAAGNYRKECHYPDLYDDSIKQCNKFEMVNCDKKPEPQAPCEYQQNLCQAANKSCDPCPQRLPSCVGKSDGLNPVPTKMWQADYIRCYKNRTMEVTKCPAGKYFNPRLNQCMKIVQPVDVTDYCKAHPKAILPDPDNCAHYFNCSDPTTATITRATMAAGNYRKECHYPDLYDDSIKQCNKFEMVNCDKKPEPQAPCEYQQNLCQAANKSCDPCPERLPSCIGKSDGLNPVPTKMWQADYIKCYKNRTMEVTKCPTGKYFNPRLNQCMKIVQPVDIPDYCKVHPAAMIPDPTNCAKFYNCTQNMAAKSAVMSECKYPDLFSRVSNKCEKFQNVSCDTRKEPQAPCEYDQNLCKPGDMKCKSCPKRLPSCRSLPDGDEAVQSALWTDLYVTCLLNRTMAVRHCPNGQVFDPNQLHCVSKIPKGNIDPFCQANPTSIVPHPDTCGQYYNCSAMSKYGHHLQECHYPDLFDEVSLTCKNFEQVKCNKSKHEPEAPCEYLQNRCNSSDPNCLPCPKRLPSCIGHPDGDNPFPNKLWMSDYITCYKNRTLNVTHCSHGYFNPRTGKCQDDVPKVDVTDYCKAHPKAILPDPDNCAHYFNCSDATTATITRATMAAGNYRKECHYPDLYDDSIKQCNQFEMVNCDKKPEPQAPCEYQQNLCQAANKSCDPCPKRLPSCIGKSDGLNPVPTKMWQADYIKCYKNRTMEVTKCPTGKYFNPRLNQCKKIVEPVDVTDYCKAHPKAILPDPDNCAHYFNCSDATTATIIRATMAAGNYRKECHYPDLYDDSIKQCNKFEMVNCDKKPEPQAPCEYQQNLCQAANKSCDPCPERLPSCVGKSDGLNPVPTKMWQADYIKCYKNRTMEVTKCPTGKYFNPRLNQCMKIVQPVDIPDYCKVHPAAMIPDPTNCAKFYNCSQNMAAKSAVTSECKYPDLFSRVSNKCERFQNVSCDTRKEPQAPCEYDQNLCKPGDIKCKSCPKRLPSCRSLPDGDEAVQSALWTDLYVTCLLNRTIAVRHCPNGQVFDPTQLHCVSKIPKGNIDPFCQANPTSIVPHPDTCGQYYNCSAMSKYGHHLQECHYPDLFDEVSLTCKNFEQVICNKSKHEPEAPCEYLQNRCDSSKPNCLPCPKRLPSCIGHPDGDNPFPNKLWKSDYITCYKNRTMNVTHCNHGYFNPRTRKCQDDVPKVDVPNYCKANPTEILPDPDNCAHYYNCSIAMATTYRGGVPVVVSQKQMECSYPDLYDPVLKMCANFTSVNCKTRKEPQAPCEYEQNLCPPGDVNCPQCPERLPSCISMPDEDNLFTTREWKPDFVICYKNRTMKIKKCSKGFYHPTKHVCTEIVDHVDVPKYCKANPREIIPDHDNCAHYFDCVKVNQNRTSRAMTTGMVSECKYPDLFDSQTLTCQSFTSVSCHDRPEPQAPCEYVQNLCNPRDSTCAKCPSRLPSCVGQSDGFQPFPSHLWEEKYIQCYKNRTMKVAQCPMKQYFNPRTLKCADKVVPVDVKDYCKAHPTAMIPDDQNCAKLYNCTDGKHTECTYPDLYNLQTQMCQNFMTTRCDSRTEPQAPCEYDQNLCPKGDPNCKPCPERLPSCRGLPDGDRPVSTALWTSKYITCLHNRTMAVRDCPPGSVFNPVTLQCMSTVSRNNVDDVCKANPGMIKPNPVNCGQYYNCSAMTKYGHHLMECTYPDLFDPVTSQCRKFYSVKCEKKHEPMAPCEYLQNLCKTSNMSCAPCSTRLPSCIGLTDGANPFPGKMWKSDFIKCDRNRTVDITHCNTGYFHPRKMICTKEVIPVDIPDYCGANPSVVLPDPDNCGRYYNCSMSPGQHARTRSLSPLKIASYHIECRYPDLFDLTTMHCADFQSVKCPNRTEPRAPCEYQQNLCTPGDITCTRCAERLPSCVGLSDGRHAVPNHLWMTGYIVCFKNRTVNVTSCARDEYFNPRLNSCMKSVIPVDIPEYCKAHRTAVIPDPDNCAKYYNCTYTQHQECKYPDLYNPNTRSCDKFTSVSCDHRQEPQAPCKYDLNKCPVSDQHCKPCPERLPSCVGLPDGLNTFPGKLWKADYIKCYKNRTIDVKACTDGYFHPVQKICLKVVQPVDVKEYCKANPSDILPDPNNCSHYYNCTQVNLSSVTSSTECNYPDLFSPVTQRCDIFTSVKCEKRPEPKAPCEYNKNICSGPSCQPCPERLPSCVGMSDGNHAFPTLMWKPDYITCYKDRTINIRKCTTGYFHPRRHVCMVDVISVDVPDYCKANPTDIIQDPTNCAQYYNCSDPSRQYKKECTYPDLFSSVTQRCERFQMVGCRKRPEPQAPCEYEQNLCSGTSCQPCPSRLPSCVGIPDGDRPFPAHLWTDQYITCLSNRTIAVRHCPSGSVFDPARLQCVNRIEQGNLPSYCQANPTSKKRHPTNCAKYIDCSSKPSPYGDYIKECPYPDLFSRVTFTCQNFTTVNCIPLQEPLSPCEYEQNLCKPNDVNCIPCSSRLPSCVGLPDGVNYYPGKLWTDSYVKCFRNRTISVEKCPSGYFHPRKHLCVKTVDRVDIPDYCQVHLDAVLPDPANCGHFFNCRYLTSHRSLEISECQYPDLFSVTTRKCEPFTNVQCQNRYEPQAPCEYVKNLCLTSDKSCIPCPGRLPSCRGLSDGLHSFPGRLWMEDYIKCFRNRTMDVSKCRIGYFNPTLRVCTTQLGRNTIPEYCKAHPTAVLSKGDNCGQYYNCSVGLTRYGRNVMECPYPDLFSGITNRCERFTTVSCKDRPEHQAPCEYQQNLCYNDPSCQPCLSRLPSCVGKQDGLQVFTGKLWTDLYVKCQQNRTISVEHCPQNQVFDPHSRQCVNTKTIKNIDEFCRANPSVIEQYADNCAMYINCSRPGHYITECHYPDLYSPLTKSCQPFKSVKCGTRPEPQKPCDYKQNLCHAGDFNCKPCSERLPSCIGLGDGPKPHSSRLWGSEYIVCDQNRTITIDRCSQGYFNPRTFVCTLTILKVDVVEYCHVHSTDVLPDPDNCAKFYKCSNLVSKVTGQAEECPYPDLFSTSTKSCEAFTTVNCGTRKEPQSPCQYQKNICSRNDLKCVPCPERLPSCVGKSDGANPFPSKLWSHDYITCLRNRTITVTKCPNSQFFNPDIRQCTTQISVTDIDSFCRANPTSLKPHPSNCAQYYNCSDVNSRYGHYLEECTYPDLFSPVTMRCQKFQTVSCDAKHEPKAPCEYRAHVCDGTVKQCTPCPERLPSCIGLTDGHHLFPGRTWMKDYIVCFKERTTVRKCDMGYFNPRLHQCTSGVGITDIAFYCRAHPGAILPHPTNCARYFRCPTSKFDSITYQEECTYPALYSTVSQSCQNFSSVSCGGRQEPQAPCEYQQNQCKPGDVNCMPCSQRLYSCRGLPDGDNAIPGHRWSDQYVTCYRNRTITIHKCATGMFDPINKVCDNKIDKDNIDEYCRSHPTSVLPHPNNCAQYFSCRDRNSQFGHYLEECPYPQLFSSITKTCVNFTSARCEQRFVPQAPCEYMQNQITDQLKSSVPCPERLPSCIGLPDSRNALPGKKWMSDYVMCYRNRTLMVYHCDRGYYFNPYRRTCVKVIDTVYIKEFCQANPTAVMPSMSNCAQYYNCQDYMTGSMLRECSYPDLFSIETMTCQRFSLVNCQQRPQPQAPCDYIKNQCRSDNTSCIPCSQRFPSCVGHPDGNNPVIGHYWSADYLICLRNRTISVNKCQSGLFDPVNRRCTLIVDISNIVSICKANPKLKFENQQNCGQYYDCSSSSSGYKIECKYPDLYSTVYQECRNYRTVMCGKRPEPQAPCDYEQNLCKPGEASCKPCPERHPSCVGRADGRNAFIPWTNQYVECLKNRTITTGRCASGIFNPIQRLCILYIHPGDIYKYCQRNPHGVIASQNNAALYYDCTQYNSSYGHYLRECPYPQLFSINSQKCEDFITVTPDKRPVPQAPCEYLQYQCKSGLCTQCEKIHHSCVGLPNGDQAISFKTWQPQYVNCYQNRTLAEKVCKDGMFDPVKKICSVTVNTDQIDVYCQQHPHALVKHPGDCALYYNCSNPTSRYGRYIEECRYPDLFSTLTLRCEHFENIVCKSRHVPQAPCEYQQNLCTSTGTNCQPCTQRLPSCIGLPDGVNPIPGRFWSKDYIQCYRNRTINVLHCKEGFFNPQSKICVTAIKSGDSIQFCNANPRILIRSSENCAQYIDCRRRKRRIGGFVKECPYPDLFSPRTLECDEFTRVTCDKVPEPQAPCSYEQNLCLNPYEKCAPCPERFPSCIGLPDGENSFAGRIWSPDYVLCYRNRTTAIKKCSTGFFDPQNRKCSSQVGTDNIATFCSHHPDARIPNKVNCAQYYDCSNRNSIFQPYLHECTYPKLFSVATLKCEDFEQVICGVRTEPKAPCQYLQNQCSAADKSCLPCPMRLPSCLGLPDGDNSYPGHKHWKQYINCYKERTQEVKDCTMGYFDEKLKRCLIQQLATPIPTCGVDQFECNNGQCIDAADRCNDHFDCSDRSDELHCVSVHVCPEGQWRCNDGQCVDPISRCDGRIQCRDKSDEVGCHYNTTPHPVMNICHNQQNGRVAHPTNCAKYYNCTDQSHPVLQECPYPFLYSPIHMSCQNFEYVQCHQRYEPKAPCEFDQNKCKPLDTGCTPCIERLPSCIGLPNGRHGFPGQLWSSKFILCHLNRTIDIGDCPDGQKFNPDGRFCVTPTVNVGKISDYCQHNPGTILPHPDNCGQFYNCSSVYTLLGSYIEECSYPKLFDINSRTCRYYTQVNCDQRSEPQGPCDYELNKCHTSDCKPCEERFVSCVDKPDGANAMPDVELPAQYVICKDGRTITQEVCQADYIYSPVSRTCIQVNKDSLDDVCEKYPGISRPHPYNCAQFIDCSTTRPGFPVTKYIKECSYPKLFSTDMLECRDFEHVTCHKRHEPIAPCEYLQNLCTGTDPNCEQCVDRLPSCRELPDGKNPISTKLWTPSYLMCHKNRTLSVDKCTVGVFDPYKKQCVNNQKPPMCTTSTGLVVKQDNCAQFYDCSKPVTELGHYIQECPYPQLFNEDTHQCEHFSQVDCRSRYQPKAPCDYLQSQCIGVGCQSCEKSHPSCIGLPDGANPYPDRPLSPHYIICDHERTISTEYCSTGIFDPTTKMCKAYSPDIINSFCSKNHGLVLPSPDNCAHFYQCGVYNQKTGSYLHECAYPSLYDVTTQTCKPFTEVNCGSRHEPKAPCEYLQNQCHVDDSENCFPCSMRLPSCIGLSNGRHWHPDPGRISQYITCEGERTVAIDDCAEGMYFEQIVKDCLPLKYYSLLLAFGKGQEVCKTSLVSGVKDDKLTATSRFGSGDPFSDYGASRGKLNTKETMDNTGKTLIGAWVSGKNDVNQYIQVELPSASLVRGITTQGRDGCCKQWTTKYRVMYSMDCKTDWKPVQQLGSPDTFFKGNFDENTPVNNMFDCPVIAKCIRINPLEWNNHAALRFDLTGCSLDSGNKAGSTNNANTVTPSTAVPTTPVPMTTTSSTPQPTQKVTAAMTTMAPVVNPSPTSFGGKGNGSGKNNFECIKDCQGHGSGYYGSCKTCYGYVTCVWGIMYERKCPSGLKWNSDLKVCDYNSKCSIP